MMPFFSFDDDEFFGDLLLMGAAGGGKAVEATATGNPLTFQTDLARPLKSLLIPFTPVQSGTGDPSPENIRPILPWNGLKVWQAGINTFDGELEKGSLDNSGNNSPSNDNVRSKNYIPVVPGAKYYIKYNATSAGASNMRTCYYRADKTYKSNAWRTNGTVTIPDDVHFVRFYMDTAYTAQSNMDIGLNYPSTETAFVPYKPITETDISFPSPVYGGEHEAVSGKLMNGWNKKTVAEIRIDKKADHIFQCYFSDRKYGAGVFSVISDTYKTITAVASTGSTIETLYATYGDGIYINFGSATFYICDSRYTDVEEFKTAMADTVVVYELATPQEIQLTPAQITALKGNNTLWSDADGQLTAVFFKKG